MRPQANPPPVPARYYSRDALLATAGRESGADPARRAGPPRPRVSRSLALAALGPGMRVVDIGCGRGEATVRAAQRGASVIALDYSPDALHLTRSAVSRAAQEGFLRAPPVVAAAVATALPVAAGSADRVLMLDIVEHLRPWQLAAALTEVRRILRPDGYVVIHTLPNRWALAFGYRLLRLIAPGLPSSPRSEYERQVHVNEQDPLRLRRALTEAGLANRVWVEEWTTRHAMRGRRTDYADAVRAAGYPFLARPFARRAAGALMATPLRWFVANDLFAVAWLHGREGPPNSGRLAAVR